MNAPEQNRRSEFRVSRGQEIPRPAAIRQFRFLNRETLRATLQTALRLAHKKVMETLRPTNPFRAASGAAVVSATPIAGPEGETTVLFRRDASERMDKASFIDGRSM
jgi:hypothetical protein